MTTEVDIVNRALQSFGTRTTVTAAQLLANSTNEAIQANIILHQYRDDLLRMAPWDCATKTGNLTYITSQPGTPENTSPATTLWAPGQPSPPWAYEYQYPVDCLRMVSIIPANQTGFAGGVPITTAVTGGAASYMWGSPIKFKIATDAFVPVTAAAVAAGGTGYNVNDIITLPIGPTTSPPIGAPAQLLVTAAPGGVISTVAVISVLQPGNTLTGGSYFAVQANPVPQASTTGSGTGATFNLTFGPASDQRVILTNQEFATGNYIKQVTDPNVMDSLFQTAWSRVVGATLCKALRSDMRVANGLIQEANAAIESARSVDGNEGLTINDVTPDWIRIRGIAYADGYVSGPYSGYDWGGFWPMFL